MSKWFIRAVWLIPALLVNLLLRLALESVLDTSFKIQLFQFVYFVLAVWLPCVYLPKLYERSPRILADRIAVVLLDECTQFCRYARLPDRMTVFLQVWAVAMYAVLPLVGEHPVKQYFNDACLRNLYKAYHISGSEKKAHEAVQGLTYAFIKILFDAEYDPFGRDPMEKAFYYFYLHGLTNDADGFDLLEILDRDHISARAVECVNSIFDRTEIILSKSKAT